MESANDGPHHRGLHLYTAGTPSGWKASVMLEELGCAYTVHPIDLAAGQQKSEAFLRLNPAGRIPVLVDYDAEGGPLTLPEAGAIMWYLAEAKDPERRFLPAGPGARSAALAWVFFQADHLTPATRTVVLARAFGLPTSEKALAGAVADLEYGYGVLDEGLGKRGGWLEGGRCSVADVACVGPVLWPSHLLGMDLQARFPHLHAWLGRMLARPGVRRGLSVPGPNPVLEAGGPAGAQVADAKAEAAAPAGSGQGSGGVAKASDRLAKLGLGAGSSEQ